jgi:hypothetical protein
MRAKQEAEEEIAAKQASDLEKAYKTVQRG